LNRPTPAVAPAANGIEVLLVDDEETIRVTLHDDLVAAGHRVTAVANGSDALYLIESRLRRGGQRHPMPGVEGTELLARVKQLRPARP
jgi:CheY-like chemotaxis protein